MKITGPGEYTRLGGISLQNFIDQKMLINKDNNYIDTEFSYNYNENSSHIDKCTIRIGKCRTCNSMNWTSITQMGIVRISFLSNYPYLNTNNYLYLDFNYNSVKLLHILRKDEENFIETRYYEKIVSNNNIYTYEYFDIEFLQTDTSTSDYELNINLRRNSSSFVNLLQNIPINNLVEPKFKMEFGCRLGYINNIDLYLDAADIVNYDELKIYSPSNKIDNFKLFSYDINNTIVYPDVNSNSYLTTSYLSPGYTNYLVLDFYKTNIAIVYGIILTNKKYTENVRVNFPFNFYTPPVIFASNIAPLSSYTICNSITKICAELSSSLSGFTLYTNKDSSASGISSDEKQEKIHWLAIGIKE